jgi:hypothetical protein
MMHHLRNRYGHARKSPKAKLIRTIRRMKSAAVLLRLRGHINGAFRYEEDLDRYVATAESRGWADEASDAEEAGLHEAERAYRKHDLGYGEAR